MSSSDLNGRRRFFLASCISLLLIITFSGTALSFQVDTLDLQFEWVYPLSVADMKLADFDFDGESEILVGFNSDSARVVIIDPSSQTVVWQSPGLQGWITTVGAGDRNGDGYLDVAVGGWVPDSYLGGAGCLWMFDGPDLNQGAAISGLDQGVMSAGIFRLGNSDTAAVVVGTRWQFVDETYSLLFWYVFTEGHLFAYNGSQLSILDSMASGLVRTVDAVDADGDYNIELISAEEHLWDTDYHGGFNRERDNLDIRVTYPDSSLIINIFAAELHYHDLEVISRASLDACAVGNVHGSNTAEIIASWRGLTSGEDPRPANLSCFDAVTGELIWSVADSVWPSYVSGLTICELSDKSTKVVCAAYSDGTIRFKDGTDGHNVAVCYGLPAIRRFAMGNVDEDYATEICIASAESIYVFEAPHISTQVEDIQEPSRPSGFSLHQNYPNPFNPETNIRFALDHRSRVRLNVYNILGECLRSFEGYYPPGTHTIIWDGKNSSGQAVASGVYLYSLTVGDCQETKKMVLLR